MNIGKVPPVIIVLVLIPLLSIAANTPEVATNGVGMGEVAQNMMEPVGLFADFVHTACFIIGGSFVFASLIKYFEHRNSPLMTPISTVVYLLLAGLILILLPFLAIIAEGGVSFSLMK